MIRSDTVPSRQQSMRLARTRMRPAAKLLLGSFMLVAGHAWAWDDRGHEIICGVALHEMKVPDAQAELHRLLSLDLDVETFGEACTWPDHPRKRARDHFVNAPRTATTIQATGCPLEGVKSCLL